ncbi:hypothetical protein D9756_011024 [Leucocoprinus leucothites]|uniref:Retrotransposon gag domain-containing protein n=1 Tax=Leucocoprinus leucothites TaxID=201217 RepID=A0A8H5CS29_9AGAR|nr:hypothetical protein D9756_011024 [Leucoagaricus leucothites]
MAESICKCDNCLKDNLPFKTRPEFARKEFPEDLYSTYYSKTQNTRFYRSKGSGKFYYLKEYEGKVVYIPIKKEYKGNLEAEFAALGHKQLHTTVKQQLAKGAGFEELQDVTSEQYVKEARKQPILFPETPAKEEAEVLTKAIDKLNPKFSEKPRVNRPPSYTSSPALGHSPRFLSPITNPIPFSFTNSPTSIATTSTLPTTNPNITITSTTITIPINTQTKGKAKANITNTGGSSNRRSPTPRPPHNLQGPPKGPRGSPPGSPGGGGGGGGGGPPNPNPNPLPNPMGQPQVGFQLKYPKHTRFDGNSSYFRPWMAEVKLYFNSYGVTDDTSRINYTLGLLDGAAKLWQQDYRLSQADAARQAGYVPHTFDQFKNVLKQLFTPTQQSFEAERELYYHKQQGKYIEGYITNFSVLASHAGLADSTSLQSYFTEGLDNDVRFKAI